MSLMRNEFRTRENARREFQKEFIRQFKRNERLPKKNCIRLCVSARLAVAVILGLNRKPGGVTLSSCREISAYCRESLGFKSDTEFYECAADAWRNRAALG